MTKKVSELRKLVTDWIEYINEVQQVITFSPKAATITEQLPNILNAIPVESLGWSKEHVDEWHKMKVVYEKLSTTASVQISDNFNQNYSLGAVLLWGAVEVLICDVLKQIIKDYPNLLEKQSIRKIKISLSDFMELSDDERRHYIVRELMTEHCVGYGSKRYESLLNIFDIKIKIGVRNQKSLYELQNVRNVIVHHRGIGDSTLIKRCGTKKYKIGKRVKIRNHDFNRYLKAVVAYATSLIEGIAGLKKKAARK